MDWFRMYGEMIDDPKIGTLDDAAFRSWVELLCAACKAEDNGNTRLKQADLNWVFRRNADVTLQQLLQRELVTINETGEIVISKWEQRQRKSDSSADRVRAHRAKAKQDKELAVGNDDETLQKRNANGLEKSRGEESNKSPNPLSADAEGDEQGESEKAKRERKPRTSLTTFLQACKQNGVKPVTGYKPLMEYIGKIGLPTDFVELAWDCFCREHTGDGANAKRLQADWQKHFYNYVTKGYYRLWVCKPDGSFELTTIGQQNRKFQEAA